VGIHWYTPDGGLRRMVNKETSAPSLCIALENGSLQLSRADDDTNIIFVNADMKVTSCRWNSTGTILAVTGSQTSQRGDSIRTVNQVILYRYIYIKYCMYYIIIYIS
jgi:hypothetical protein